MPILGRELPGLRRGCRKRFVPKKLLTLPLQPLQHVPGGFGRPVGHDPPTGSTGTAHEDHAQVRRLLQSRIAIESPLTI